MCNSAPLRIGLSDTAATGTNIWGGTVCRHVTALSEVPGAAGSLTITCPANVGGRYLYIQTPGSNRHIVAREVFVTFPSPPPPMPSPPPPSPPPPGYLAKRYVGYDALGMTRASGTGALGGGAVTWQTLDTGANAPRHVQRTKTECCQSVKTCRAVAHDCAAGVGALQVALV